MQHNQQILLNARPRADHHGRSRTAPGPAMADAWKDTAKSILAKHFLLGELEPSVLDQLLGYGQYRTFGRGAVIFRKGDPGDSLLAVLFGKIRISTLSADGQEIVLNVLGAGEVFGEIAFLDGKTRTAEASALEDTGLLVLQRSSFFPFVEAHPKVAMQLLEVLCARLRWVSDNYEDVIFLDLPARLAKRLLRLAERFGKPAEGGTRVAFKLSQQELGHMTGVTREAVNKVLRTWEEQDILSIERAALTIHKIDELALIAQAQ
jgi:CRP/FNR family transcriptional regulator, cyclic AMP receptor protein